MFSGGKDGEEQVNCFVYDPLHELVIVAGVTTSSDYAPTDPDQEDSQLAFMYAIDLDGFWKWGYYF